MEGWKEDDLQWRAMQPFGVEIGSDLRDALQGKAAVCFVSLFQDFGLIVARGQSLSMDEQRALMGLLGPIVHGTDGSSYMSNQAGYAAASAELGFHSDYAFTDHPIQALSLHGVDLVDGASSTRFASAERGYALLPADLRERLRDEQAEMIMASFDSVVVSACDDRAEAVISLVRPAVAEPAPGRPCLSVSEMHARRVEGLEDSDSRALLHSIFDRLYAPDNVLEHVWSQGDIVIWDNVRYHHARGSVAAVGKRVMQRVAVGEKSLEEMHPAIFQGAGFGEPDDQPAQRR